jgi:transposase
VKTINEIAQEYGVHPVQVGQYKKQILAQAGQLFEARRGPKPVSEHSEPERLYSEIGKLKMELDWLKKSQGSTCRNAAHMDRRGQGNPCDSTVRAGRRVARNGVCKAHATSGRGAGSSALPADRRAVYAAAILWQPKNGGASEGIESTRQSQACAAPDACDGPGGHGAGAKHKQSASRAQGLSLPSAGRADRQAEPGVEYPSRTFGWRTASPIW